MNRRDLSQQEIDDLIAEIPPNYSWCFSGDINHVAEAVLPRFSFFCGEHNDFDVCIYCNVNAASSFLSLELLQAGLTKCSYENGKLEILFFYTPIIIRPQMDNKVLMVDNNSEKAIVIVVY